MSLDASDAIEDGDARVSCESAQWKDDVVHLLELERRTMDAILNSGPTETRARSRERLRGRVLSVDDAASLRTTRFER